MNRETQCTLSNDVLIDKAQEWVSKLSSTGGKAWSLQVPVNFNEDPDMLFIELTKRLKEQDEFAKRLILHMGIEFQEPWAFTKEHMKEVELILQKYKDSL